MGWFDAYDDRNGNACYYDVIIMDTDGNKYELEGYMPSGTNAIYFDWLEPYPFPGTTYYVTDNDLIHNEMLSTGTIRFSITERDDTWAAIEYKGYRGYMMVKFIQTDLVADADPETNVEAEEAPEDQEVYTTVKGDTLWNISKKYLGSGHRYKEIMKANVLKSSVIRPGMVLKIPKQASDLKKKNGADFVLMTRSAPDSLRWYIE